MSTPTQETLELRKNLDTLKSSIKGKSRKTDVINKKFLEIFHSFSTTFPNKDSVGKEGLYRKKVSKMLKAVYSRTTLPQIVDVLIILDILMANLDKPQTEKMIQKDLKQTPLQSDPSPIEKPKDIPVVVDKEEDDQNNMPLQRIVHFDGNVQAYVVIEEHENIGGVLKNIEVRSRDTPDIFDLKNLLFVEVTYPDLPSEKDVEKGLKFVYNFDDNRSVQSATQDSIFCQHLHKISNCILGLSFDSPGNRDLLLKCKYLDFLGNTFTTTEGMDCFSDKYLQQRDLTGKFVDNDQINQPIQSFLTISREELHLKISNQFRAQNQELQTQIEKLTLENKELREEFEKYVTMSLKFSDDVDNWEENPLKKKYQVHVAMESLKYLILVDYYNFAENFCPGLQKLLKQLLDRVPHVKFVQKISDKFEAKFQQVSDNLDIDDITE